MIKLSNLKVNQILTKFAEEHPQFELTESQIVDTQILYDRLMNEKVNQTKNAWEQESLITDIATGLAIGEDPELIFREHADNKHLNYFDVFLRKGETEKILQIFYEYGISTDILKGLKKNVPDDYTIDGVRVIQEISNDPNVSPQIINFEIYKDGKRIYKWTPNDIAEEEDEEEESDLYEPDFNYNPKIEQVINKFTPPTKSGKLRKGVYIATIISSEGKPITKEMTSNGRFIYRDSNGRFTKK